MPKISVIIPAYNQAQYLADALQSVLDQTYPGFEVIVVDDGSTDDTYEVVDGFSDPRLRYIYQENRGLSGARNTGIRLTSAPYLSFLDSDDLFLPEKLALLADVLDKKPEIGMAAGQAVIIDAHGHKTGNIFDRPVPEDLHSLLIDNPLHVGSVLLRRSWQEKVGFFDENLRACEDWDMWLRLAYASCNMVSISQPVSLYRMHLSQMTREAARMRSAMLFMLDKFFNNPNLSGDWLEKKALAYASAYINSAARAYYENDYKSAKTDLLTAVQLRPDFIHDDYDQLVKILVGWSKAPRPPEPEEYLFRISQNLPVELKRLQPKIREAIVNEIIGAMFSSSRERIRTQKLKFLKAVLNKPQWFFNRGVIRLLADAWLLDR